MDSLKKRVAQARSGTGEVRLILSSVTFQPRAAAFTSLIQAASKSKNPEKALEIFHTMQEVFGIPPNTFSSSALIAALAKSGQWQLAEHYFNDLLLRSKSDPRCLPNTITFSALLNAYEKGGQFSRALNVFHQQLEAMVDPDIITFSSLIAACERAGEVDIAIAMLDVMHNFGLSGTHQMYSAVISATRNWSSALEVFLGMQCAMVEPNSQVMNALLQCAAASGAVQPILDATACARLCGVSVSSAALSAVREAAAWLGAEQELEPAIASLAGQVAPSPALVKPC